MKIEGRLSNTFYLLNVISILLIVCMHSVVPVKDMSSSIVMNFVFKGITRIAVPIFFLVSSCLFFRDYTDSLYCKKIKKRFRSLMIPYFTTILIYFIFYYCTQQIPAIRGVYNDDKIVENYTWTDFFSKVFIVPINPALWFLRDLFVLYLFSPVLYHINRNKYLSVLWSVILFYMWVSHINIHYECLFFVNIGCVIVMNYDSFTKIKLGYKSIYVVCFILYILESLLLSILFSTGIITEENGIYLLILKTLIVAGVFSTVLLVYRYSDFLCGTFLQYIMKYSFFIYLFHMLIIHIVRNVGAYVLPNYPLMIYGFTIILTLTISVLSYNLIKKLFPSLLCLVLGGRV